MKRIHSGVFAVLIGGLFLTVDLIAGEQVSSDAAVVAGLTSDQPVEESAELKGVVRSSLFPVWEGYRSDVATAEIEYLALLFTLKSRRLTCDEFLEELATVSLEPDQGLTRRLVEKFCPEKLTGDAEQDSATLNAVGDWREFRQQGRDLRCVSKVFEHLITDDIHLLVDHPNKAVKAYRRGACEFWYEQMNWFRTIPTEALVEASTYSTPNPDTYRLEYYGPAKENERNHTSWLEMDRNDGIPRQWRLISPQTGKTLRMELFQDVTQYPGDVLLPAIHVKVNLRDEHVTNVQMTVIRKAQFNAPMEKSAFLLGVPAKWAWFDLQLEDEMGGYWPEAVADVAAFFRGRSNTGVANRTATEAWTASSFGWRPTLLILNGAVLIVVGVLLWRRAA